jgi:hypothetical protein
MPKNQSLGLASPGAGESHGSKCSMRGRFFCRRPIDAAAEEPMVRRLSAGRRRIRTIGPAKAAIAALARPRATT